MASMDDRLNKFREERFAREKARIEKLRELNLKKYNKNDTQLSKTSSIVNPTKSKSDANAVATAKYKSDSSCTVKNNINISKNNLKRPTSVPSSKISESHVLNTASKDVNNINKKTTDKDCINVKNIAMTVETNSNDVSSQVVVNGNVHETESKKNIDSNVASSINTNRNTIKCNSNSVKNGKPLVEISSKPPNHIRKNILKISAAQNGNSINEKGKRITNKNNFTTRQSIAVAVKDEKKPKVFDKRKTMHPDHKVNCSEAKESVFDRLYKPKVVLKTLVNDELRQKTDPKFLKQAIKNDQFIKNKRKTMFEQKKSVTVRRSISAIHFKRVRKSELVNCVHKWASIGEEIDKEHLQDIYEDACVRDEKVISAVKSERKKVKFQTPLPFNFNTPRPEEMHAKLQNWLQKRGKSLDSYHHLQCFGIHHLSKDIRPFHLDTLQYDDDDNKENIALENDSDNDSYLENKNRNGDVDEEEKVTFSAQKWRRASNITDTSDYNESYNTTLTSGETMHHVDELLLGALNDLTELLREGFDWEQCARWLRALRERFPSAPESAPYWECRAALEERRGDLHATVQCLEQAIAKGTEQSVVEANLDNLLDKFMQLKISPSGGRQDVDPKLVDVKNVFKSTIIRFAVQQAKLRQSMDTPKYTVTPVRRSNRLSRIHTPVHVCTTIQQAEQFGAEFKRNKALSGSP